MGDEDGKTDFDEETVQGPREFEATRWSVVVRAKNTQLPEARVAITYLCERYWYPLYYFVRRKYGKSHHEAQDLTQGFFAKVISEGYVKRAEESQGKFRSFLLAHFEHYLNNEYRKDIAQKRGGGRAVLSLDAERAERRYGNEPVDTRTPELLFDRKWALEVFEGVIGDLRSEFEAKGKEALFEEIKPYLVAKAGEDSYAQVAGRLGASDGSVKVEVHRLRKRFKKLVRDQVAHTVESAEDVDEELSYLLGLLAGQ